MGEDQNNRIIKYTSNIIKSPEDKRLYKALELSNKLKILLISDSTTDKSGVCLTLDVGSLSDPDDIPGLAHFCEHMLFLGTEKYPCENEFQKFLSEHGGYGNAGTSANTTAYYFEIPPEHLEGAMDRFVQFFLSPLFNESCIEREVNAVNSEHEGNVADDNVRLYQLDKHTSRRGHQYKKFGTGNKKTLMETPKEKGISIRDELLKFHNQWYSSNLMTLAVFGKETFEELEKITVPMFSNIENKNVEKPEWAEHPLGPEELEMKTYVVPVKDLRRLSIDFPVPDFNDYRTEPYPYICRLLKNEGFGSLKSVLKAKGWCYWIDAVVYRYSNGKGFRVFNISANLTEEGIEHVDDIVTSIFQYLQMLKEAGPQKWFYEELGEIRKTQFRFKDKEEPLPYTIDLAEDLQHCTLYGIPVEEILNQSYSYLEWNPELIETSLNYLKPSNSRMFVVGQKFESITTEIEPWYGTKYKIEKIPKETIEKWENCGLSDELKLPKVNELIPSNFDILFNGDTKKTSSKPSLIRRTPLTRAWFKQDDQFLLPKANLVFEFISPLAHFDPLSLNSTLMFTRLLKDSLEEYSYSATIAGFSWTVFNTRYGIMLTIFGYNDKQHILLDKVLEKMTQFEVDPKRFDIIKEEFVRGLKNYEKDEPEYQAEDYLTSLLSNSDWTVSELLEATSEMTVEKLQDFIPRLLSRLHIECLIHGNVTEEQALSLVEIVETRLNAVKTVKTLLPSQLLRFRGIRLTDGSNFVYESSNIHHKSSCVIAYYQYAEWSIETSGLIKLLVQILDEPCFNILRTKEQLGYTVSCDVKKWLWSVGLTIRIQSEKHPRYLDQRIEAFLIRMRESMEKMTEEDFEKHKKALIKSKWSTIKDLRTLTDDFWDEIASRRYYFDKSSHEIDYIKTITKQQLLEFFDSYIKFKAPHRRKLSVHVISEAEGGAGTLPPPDPESLSSAIDDLNKPPPYFEPIKIDDFTNFKRIQGVFSLPKQYMNIEDHLSNLKSDENS